MIEDAMANQVEVGVLDASIVRVTVSITGLNIGVLVSLHHDAGFYFALLPPALRAVFAGGSRARQFVV
jgi:hypothetical protein